MHSKITSAQFAFQNWRKKSFKERQILLERLADILESEEESHARRITEEMNKPIAQSRAEIQKCVAMIRYYAQLPYILQPERIDTEYEVSRIQHEPLGIILGIMPWNFPYWQVYRFAIPTLLSGNTVLLKHSSICKGSGDAIELTFEKVGFEKGIFTHMPLTHQETESLLENPLIRGVSLTGSEAAGRKIAALAGKNLKKCVLELGGNDAFIVLKSANLEQAAKDAALGRLQNTGQTCVSAKRFIVEESIFEVFMKLFISEYKQYKSGDLFSSDTNLGKMARTDLADELVAQYEKAITHGAEVIIPLKRLDETTFEPGILLMNPENPISDEELFGPLAMVFKVKDSEEALQLANSSRFGLANAIYTRDERELSLFADRLESGSVALNQIFRSDARMPFGGIKNSGFGTELSPYALFEFTHKKSILGNK